MLFQPTVLLGDLSSKQRCLLEIWYLPICDASNQFHLSCDVPLHNQKLVALSKICYLKRPFCWVIIDIARLFPIHEWINIVSATTSTFSRIIFKPGKDIKCPKMSNSIVEIMSCYEYSWWTNQWSVQFLRSYAHFIFLKLKSWNSVPTALAQHLGRQADLSQCHYYAVCI